MPVREQNHQTLTIASGQTKSTAINMRGYCGGTFATPAAMVGTTITFEVSVKQYDHKKLAADVPDADFVPLYDSTGAQVSQTVSASAARAFPIPLEALGASFLRLVAGSAQSGGAISIDVGLKS